MPTWRRWNTENNRVGKMIKKPYAGAGPGYKGALDIRNNLTRPVRLVRRA
jgi:hypothetical protein